MVKNWLVRKVLNKPTLPSSHRDDRRGVGGSGLFEKSQTHLKKSRTKLKAWKMAINNDYL